MSVAIHQPEIEALIAQHLATGAFQDVEAVLIHALNSAPIPPSERQPKQNLADFLMESPLHGFGLEFERFKDLSAAAEL